MKRAAILLFLVGCAPATLTMLGEDPSYTVLATNKRGKANVYKCTKPEKADEFSCSLEKPGTSSGYSTGTGSSAPQGYPASSKEGEEIKSKLASPDGCMSTTAEEFNKLKSISKADYYFFKAYCARDANPGKACGYYKDFLKVAPGDGRKGQATAFIQSQDSTAYAECTLP